MHISRIKVSHFRALKDVDITFEKDFEPRIFPLASQNGGGKSTLLQLVFILLNCSAKPKFHNYIKNILSDINPEISLNELITIYLWDELLQKEVELHFNIIHEDEFKEKVNEWTIENPNAQTYDISKFRASIVDFNFRAALNISKIIESEDEFISETINILVTLKEIRNNLKKMPQNTIQSVFFEKNKHWADTLNSLVDSVSGFRVIDSKKTIGILVDKINKLFSEYESLLDDFYLWQTIKLKSNEAFTINITSFSTSQEGDFILTCYSPTLEDNLSDFLTRISSQIFLLSPSSQVFLFLNRETRKLLFKSNQDIQNNYFSSLNTQRYELSGFYVHDFIPVETLIESFKIARDKDFEIAIQNDGDYGENYSQLLQEITRILPSKKANPKADLSEIYFMGGENYKQELYPEDLSHGELKRLGIYLWMKNQKIQNSIVLIDELEIGLHPDWQYQIIEDLRTFFPDNQYIIATHSYDICEAVTPAHVKELSPEFKLRTAQ